MTIATSGDGSTSSSLGGSVRRITDGFRLNLGRKDYGVLVAVFTRDFAYFCYNSEIIGELSPHASR